MIAKAKSIKHGCNAIRYAVNKKKADVIRMNLLGKALDATAAWAQMLIHQKHCDGMYGRHRSLTNNAIRIEISPARYETVGWTRQDWENLLDEYLQAFDSIDLSATTNDPNSKRTNIAHSQYVVALHHDSKGGIEHLHLIANRVDCNGHVNDDHMIHRRAMEAAAIVNARRNWIQADRIRSENIVRLCDDCSGILRNMSAFSWEQYCAELMRLGYGIRLKRDSSGRVRGYTVRTGNTTYKSSELGPERNLMPSKIEHTWRQLHPVTNRPYESGRSVVSNKANIRDVKEKPEVSYRIVNGLNHIDIHIPSEINTIMTNEISKDGDTGEISRTDVSIIAAALFVGLTDVAVDKSCSCGGGGTAPSSDWGRDKKEEDMEWARRCARMALQMARPKRRRLKR